TGVRTDFRGYTTLGYLSPYQKNEVSIDPSKLPDDAALAKTSVFVVPTKGAVVKVAFGTSVGKRLLLTLLRGDGTPVPFGAVSTVEGHDGSSGIVGDKGRVYLTGMLDKGEVMVRWGQGQSQHCTAVVQVPDEAGPAGVYTSQVQCR
ncbi:FimD/PapC C-terminal domain-containing protein, partial [Salmonella enterica]|uniref:FimD/PapC C-terminal domain-containing protein n=1 Tax=Salmonella enterica TaxID=28901 RepID=UPI003D317F50